MRTGRDSHRVPAEGDHISGRFVANQDSASHVNRPVDVRRSLCVLPCPLLWRPSVSELDRTAGSPSRLRSRPRACSMITAWIGPAIPVQPVRAARDGFMAASPEGASMRSASLQASASAISADSSSPVGGGRTDQAQRREHVPEPAADREVREAGRPPGRKSGKCRPPASLKKIWSLGNHAFLRTVRQLEAFRALFPSHWWLQGLLSGNDSGRKLQDLRR